MRWTLVENILQHLLRNKHFEQDEIISDFTIHSDTRNHLIELTFKLYDTSLGI